MLISKQETDNNDEAFIECIRPNSFDANSPVIQSKLQTSPHIRYYNNVLVLLSLG